MVKSIMDFYSALKVGETIMSMGNLYAIDLFSGCGGTSAGLNKAGIKVKVAVEVNPIASKTYKKNHKNTTLIQDDICNVTGTDLLRKANMSEGDYLLLVACPPCQGFSAIRKNGNGDGRNKLVFQFTRLIDELNPEFILMENVAGMSRRQGKDTFKEALSIIENKYDVSYDILNAADYGVPQTRKRLVLHGIRKDIGIKLGKCGYIVSLPEKTHIDPKKKTELCDLPIWKSASVILDFPSIKAGESYNGEKKIYNHCCNRLSDINLRRIQYIRKHGGSRTCLPPDLSLKCHKGKQGHTDVYGILDADKPSPTITGGCMYTSKGRFGHPTQDRALSAREAARLQSFPDDYLFFGTNSQIALQIGNAVPVDLAKASGEYFYKLYHALKVKNN